jgi:hypothetical protein
LGRPVLCLISFKSSSHSLDAGATEKKRIAIYPACSRGGCMGFRMTVPREQAG